MDLRHQTVITLFGKGKQMLRALRKWLLKVRAKRLNQRALVLQVRAEYLENLREVL